MALLGVAYGLLAALVVLSNFVIIPVHVSLILHSFLIIYIGSHLSLDQEAEEVMSEKDAYMFPVFASITLGSLYVVYKLFDKETVNMLLSLYFVVLGALAVWGTVRPFLVPVFTRLGMNAKRHVFGMDRTIPLLGEVKFKIELVDVACIVVAAAFSYWYYTTKYWLANNIIGIAFSIQAVENLNVGEYKVGAIMLCGLFFYDIFWVFGTDVMVTVAKSVDGPIKLLFPRSFATHDTDAQFSLLGLGDIVLPGIFIALLLRFDRHLHLGAKGKGVPDATYKAVGATATFSKQFFNVNMVAYVLGLIATVVVMVVFEAAQPALLYLVPACVGTSALQGLLTGRFSTLFAYSEDPGDDKKESSKQDDSSKDATEQDSDTKDAVQQDTAPAAPVDGSGPEDDESESTPDVVAGADDGGGEETPEADADEPEQEPDRPRRLPRQKVRKRRAAKTED